ncbi:MAG: sigma-70 family RNA polymerase sigma factor, partial [Microbacterium sp.]
EAAQRGDRRAFDRLLRPHRDQLWGVCLRVTGRHADAEDAVQECLVAIWRGLPRFRGDSSFTTWAYRIAANAALAVVRRRHDVNPEVDVADHRRAFDDVVAERDEIQRALAGVPESFRVALVLREYGGLTYDEIAEHEGIPVQTVKSRINRARAAVRAALVEGF